VTTDDERERAEILRGIGFFRKCTPREIDDIAKLAVDRNYGPGEELCHQTDATLDAFTLIEGEVTIIADGEQVATARAGDVIGELSMLGSGHRTATVVAVTPVRAFVIDPREVDSVLAADPSAAQRLGGHEVEE
jgi:CRP/FNR family transcriptional regulator, cyclic AMP receptor protein